MVNEIVSIGSLVVAAIVAIWGVYQTKVTKQLERELYRMNVGLDQRIHLLHRAREAVINQHRAHVFLLNYSKVIDVTDELHASKSGELSAYQAELRGLAFAVGDEELLKLVNESYPKVGDNEAEAMGYTRGALREMHVRGRSQQLHTRISQLLEETTVAQTG